MTSYLRSQATNQSIIPMHSKQIDEAQTSHKESSIAGGTKRNQTNLSPSQQENEGNPNHHGSMPMPTLLTVPQVAQQLNVCRAHVYKLIHQGLPTIHLGRSVRISAASLQHWLAVQENL